MQNTIALRRVSADLIALMAVFLAVAMAGGFLVGRSVSKPSTESVRIVNERATLGYAALKDEQSDQINAVRNDHAEIAVTGGEDNYLLAQKEHRALMLSARKSSATTSAESESTQVAPAPTKPICGIPGVLPRRNNCDPKDNHEEGLSPNDNSQPDPEVDHVGQRH